MPPEGSLAPAGYDFQRGDTRGATAGADGGGAAAGSSTRPGRARAPDLPLSSPEELLTLASIVEKETGVAEERRRVAAVFVNRLRRGMRLQTDPSVIYGITEGEGPLGRGLRASELATATPYNTYVREGLPPTPIANPGAGGDRGGGQPGGDGTTSISSPTAPAGTPSPGRWRSTTATSRPGGGSRRERAAAERAAEAAAAPRRRRGPRRGRRRSAERGRREPADGGPEARGSQGLAPEAWRWTRGRRRRRARRSERAA